MGPNDYLAEPRIRAGIVRFGIDPGHLKLDDRPSWDCSQAANCQAMCCTLTIGPCAQCV